jgi:DNA polymerase
MTAIRVGPEGPLNAKVMIVGEAPGKNEVDSGRPFVGSSGLELTKMLNEVGIARTDCFITNAVKHQPPGNKMEAWIDVRKTQPAGFVRHPSLSNWIHPLVLEGVRELESELDEVRPNLVIALGNTPLWALTGLAGITKWRGSLLASRELQGRQYKVLPTFHPAAILRAWELRFATVHDLRRGARESTRVEIPQRDDRFVVRPSYDTVRSVLQSLILRANAGADITLGTDIETRNRQLACIALGWSRNEALCIPFLTFGNESGSYWSQEEEVAIVLLLREVLTHPQVKVIWQNGLYDLQYICRYWGFIPNFSYDTMLAQHVMFAILPKDLSFISSLHCENHVYWKDDGKKYDPKKDPEEKHWSYNCRDAVVTNEAAESLQSGLTILGFRRTQYGSPIEIQHRMAGHVLRAMLRGIRWDFDHAKKLLWDLGEARVKREQYINTAVGRMLNTNSPKQLQALFYIELGQKPIISRKTKNPTTDADALETLGKRDPALLPLCTLINEVRALRTALGFVGKSIDADGRIRCSFNPAGTETYRFSSAEDAFDFGTNLQNVTAGTPEKEIATTPLPMPNMRRLFLPDPGKTWADFDLPQADARVVAWDADDTELMAIFADPKADLHTENAKAIFGYCPHKDHPNRQLAKKGVHAVNYLVGASELSRHLGITTHEAQKFIDLWLGAHPKIKAWHDRIRHEVQTRRYVENIYGYRRYVFERIDDKLIKEIVAWIPQSTTAITINLGIDAVCNDKDLTRRGTDFLLQVHDSADFQYPTFAEGYLLPRILKRLTVEVPYPRPLIMPPGVKKSTKSWGDCG